jgi:hypothetical protein
VSRRFVEPVRVKSQRIGHGALYNAASRSRPGSARPHPRSRSLPPAAWNEDSLRFLPDQQGLSVCRVVAGGALMVIQYHCRLGGRKQNERSTRNTG